MLGDGFPPGPLGPQRLTPFVVAMPCGQGQKSQRCGMDMLRLGTYLWLIEPRRKSWKRSQQAEASESPRVPAIWLNKPPVVSTNRSISRPEFGSLRKRMPKLQARRKPRAGYTGRTSTWQRHGLVRGSEFRGTLRHFRHHWEFLQLGGSPEVVRQRSRLLKGCRPDVHAKTPRPVLVKALYTLSLSKLDPGSRAQPCRMQSARFAPGVTCYSPPPEGSV